MVNTTIRDLAPGGAVSDGDLLISRQGADTVDTSITALQIKTYIGAISSVAWGDITGTLSAQTDLQAALDAKQATGNYITALTGDITASGPGSVAATLATVNSNVGAFGSSTSIPSFTVNAKGLITAASGNAVIAPAGTLTGTTLASNVVTSSLTSVGTLGSLSVTGTTTSGNLTLTDSTNHITFTSGAFTGVISVNALGNNRTWALPNSSGTIILTTSTSIPNLATIGTVTTGTWNATPIAEAYGGVPTGGTLGQVLTKDSGSDYDASWQTPTGGSSAFNDLTSGTNTTAAMVVGTGASLGVSGSGTIAATTSASLATGRNISISGDLTYTSPSFDGTGNVTAAGTLATVNADVGSFTYASLTVNAKGLITAASNGTPPYVPGGTDVSLADGGTGASLTDPNADRIMFWDDSAGAVTWLTASTGLTITGTNMTVRTASATQTGIIEIATNAEVTTGTDTTRAITPSSLTSITQLGTVTTGTWSANFGAVSGANLTNLTAANISAGTAGINISGNAATATSATTATTATTATNVTVANEASDTTCFPLFATAATGDLGPKTNAGLTFNSSTGALAATSFVGPLTGNVTGNVSGSSGSTTGNAATATALATGRTIAITGDLAYTSPSFDGTGNVTAAGTLATVNANVGSFTYASITVNAKGLITAASNGTAPYVPGGTDVAVADGGTGRSSQTAYAVICGGTTSTSAQQSVASVGTAGQVLTSNGAGALPTFEDAASPPWTLVDSETIAAPIGLVSITGLGSYGEIMIVLDELTSSAAGVRCIQAIDSGGAITGSVYLRPNDAPDTRITINATASGSARSGNVKIGLFNTTEPIKPTFGNNTSSSSGPVVGIKDSSAFTGFQVFDSLGNLTGGTIYAYGR